PAGARVHGRAGARGAGSDCAGSASGAREPGPAGGGAAWPGARGRDAGGAHELSVLAGARVPPDAAVAHGAPLRQRLPRQPAAGPAGPAAAAAPSADHQQQLPPNPSGASSILRHRRCRDPAGPPPLRRCEAAAPGAAGARVGSALGCGSGQARAGHSQVGARGPRARGCVLPHVGADRRDRGDQQQQPRIRAADHHGRPAPAEQRIPAHAH
ncbi:hypothetical protein EV177_010216, partial [Coemansia sp. RSA 1804]